jgi:hypothetical protein
MLTKIGAREGKELMVWLGGAFNRGGRCTNNCAGFSYGKAESTPNRVNQVLEGKTGARKGAGFLLRTTNTF